MLSTIRSRTLPLSIRRFASAAHATAPTSSTAPRYSPLASKAADEVSSKWKGTNASGGKTMNYIGGEFVESQATKWLEVRDPVSVCFGYLGDVEVHEDGYDVRLVGSYRIALMCDM
jgi:hypothetical protein